MTYTIVQTNNTENIAEKQWGQHPTQIMFTEFTSCIGVVVKTTAGNVWGLHLVITNDQNDFMTPDDMRSVVAQIPGGQQAFLIGHISIWEDGVPQTYSILEAKINTYAQRNFYERNNGVYGGRIQNGNLVPRN